MPWPFSPKSIFRSEAGFRSSLRLVLTSNLGVRPGVRPGMRLGVRLGVRPGVRGRV